MRGDKSQISNTKSQKKPKHQMGKKVEAGWFEIWDLEFVWDLGFGIWDFRMPPGHATRNTDHVPLAIRHRPRHHAHPSRHHHLPGHHLAGRHEERKGHRGG